MELTGYKRRDGRVGFRNYVLIVPLSGCVSEIARRISDQVSGTTVFTHANGCDLHGDDFDLLGTILENTCTHPNVGAVVFLTMGCASTLSLKLPQKVEATGRPVEVINTQQVGGTRQSVAEGVKAAQAMVNQLQPFEREKVLASALVLGTKCGASDQNSLEYCHPVIGKACDKLVDQGATVVLSEDAELTPGAHELAQRATDQDIADNIRTMAEKLNSTWENRFGYSFEEFKMRHVSKEEMRQQSRRQAAKAGTYPISGFFDMSEKVEGKGLKILNAPNTDLENMTCLAAAGCNLTLFTTGRGTPCGSPTSLVLKITATRKTAERMAENIDVSVADYADGTENIDSAADRVVEAITSSANGASTSAEALGHYEVAIPVRGVTY